FYAHECARLELGLAPDVPRTVGDAWRADCRALDAIVASGLMAPRYVARLQAGLVLTDTEWSAPPGPQRETDLPACARVPPRCGCAVRRRPTPAREGWNACGHRCGDTLLQCPLGTSNRLGCPDCLPANEACGAACGDPNR